MQIKIYSLLFLLAISGSLHAQSFHNLDFRQVCDTSATGLCYWDLSWGKGSVQPETINGSKFLTIKGKTENSVGFAEQNVNIPPKKVNQIITVGAVISTENVQGKGAGLNLGLYDKNGDLIANKDMGGFYSVDWIKGTNAEKKYSISIVSPPGVVKIKIGVILYGSGKAYFKGYFVNIIGLKNRKPSPLAIQYISAVCDTIKLHSLFRDSFDLKTKRSIALKIAGPAITYSDCFLAVEYLLQSLRPLGDEHSFFMKAKEVENWKKGGSSVQKIENPSYKIINSCGYILVPPFHGGNPALMLEYADSLQLAIKKMYASGIKGWVIDLRQNTGGNQEPMIAGLGPLFSTDKLGSLFDVNNIPQSWYYKNGKYFGDGDDGWNVSDPVVLPYSLPVAVLTSGLTGSSGEIVTLSFIGNEKTRSFGHATWGLTTGNGSFELKDKSELYLASTIMADRNGTKYYGPIKPDVEIIANADNKTDPELDAAILWVKSAVVKN